MSLVAVCGTLVYLKVCRLVPAVIILLTIPDLPSMNWHQPGWTCSWLYLKCSLSVLCDKNSDKLQCMNKNYRTNDLSWNINSPTLFSNFLKSLRCECKMLWADNYFWLETDRRQNWNRYLCKFLSMPNAGFNRKSSLPIRKWLKNSS